MIPALIALQGVSMPTDGQSAWTWVAGTAAILLVLMGGALGTVFWHVVADKDKQITRLQEDGKICAGELGKTSDSLQKMTDVSERQRQTVVEGFMQQRQTTAEGFERVGKKVDDLMDLIAPRRKE